MAKSTKTALSSLLTASIIGALIVFAPGSAAASYGAYGTKVEKTSTDYNPTYVALAAATICSRDVSNAAVLTDDQFYINIDGAGTTVGAFDVRLNTVGSNSKGTLVTAGSTDNSQTFTGMACAAFDASVRYAEADGLPGWTAGDLLYWSANAIVDVGDVRLAIISSATNQDSQSITDGTVVQATTDADAANIANNNGKYPDCTPGPPQGAVCASSAILLGAGDFTLQFFDLNLNGALDTGDSVLIANNAAGSPAPLSSNINDIYLVGSTFGSRVTRSAQDYLVEPELFVVQPVFAYNRLLGADSNCDRLWFHFRNYDGIANVVQVDDIVAYMPSTSLTSCSNPPPASTVALGTRVSQVTSHLQGTAFTGVGATTLAAQIFYADSNSNNVYDRNDPVYVNRPATSLGGSSDTLTVTAGDLRLTTIAVGASTYQAGTVVGGTDADISAFASVGINNEAGKSWVVRKLNNDGANEIPLASVASIMFHDANSNDFWDPGTESVYLDVGTTANGCGAAGTTRCVNSGDFLLHDGSDLSSTTPSVTTPIDCVTTPPTDCAALTATFDGSTDFKVTGADATINANFGETIYYSRDAIVNGEDWALPEATGSGIATGQVSATCALSVCLNEGVHQSDVLYVSWCTGGACPGRLISTDLQVSPTSGTRVTTTGADFVPSIQALPTAGGTLIRYDRSNPGQVNDDVFYASPDGSTVTTQDTRLTPKGTTAAGTVLTSSDAEELSATVVAGTAGGLAALIAARDVDGTTGYTLGDPIYLDLPAALGGSAGGDLTVLDIRLTPTAGFAAGTFVQGGNTDLITGTAFTGLGAWTLGFFDDNTNAIFDTGDVLYALPPGSPALGTLPQAPLGAVRLNGPASSGGGGGGGGGVTTTPTTPATTATTTPTVTTTPTETATTTPSTEETTRTQEPTDTTETTEGDTPGFGLAAFVVAGLVATAFWRRRRA